MATSLFVPALFPRRSSRPRPSSFPSIVALFGGTGYLCARFPFSFGNGGGKLGGGGRGGRIGGENTGDTGNEDEALVKDAINPIGAERSHSIGNDGIDKIRLHNVKTVANNLVQMDNTLSRTDNNQTKIAIVIGPTLVVSTSPTDKPNKIEGLLKFIHTSAYAVLGCYGALVALSVAYLGSSKALVSFGDAGTIPILITNVMSLLLGSVLLLPYAGHFEGAKSADHIGFDIFIGAVLVWWLAFIIECCVTLHVYLKIKNLVIWSIGAAVFCLTLFSKVAYLEYQRPKMRKWAIWKKTRNFFGDLKTSLSQRFGQGESISRPNA